MESITQLKSDLTVHLNFLLSTLVHHQKGVQSAQGIFSVTVTVVSGTEEPSADTIPIEWPARANTIREKSNIFFMGRLKG